MPTIAAPPAPTPSPSLNVNGLIESVESFVVGVLSLDPEQAALRGGLTLLVVVGAMLLIWGLRLLYKAMSERVAPDTADLAGKKQRPLGRWALRIARLTIFTAALLVVLRLWGVDLANLRDGPLGNVFGAATRIAIILVVSFVALELTHLGITRMFARIAARARNPRRAAQVRTLAPLLTGIVTTVFVVIAAMMALSEIGVQIAPLIAGAGIVGLAIGFGAQTLVKDFLTGIFLVLEDIVSIGDVAAIGDVGGVVEDMSLRTIKLRDGDGTLHIFPYSEAQVIHNRTKGFSRALIDLTVDLNVDIRRALELMQETGEALRADPAFAGMITEAVDVVGVEKLMENGIVLRASIRTLPGKHWAVRRAYLLRIKEAFDAAGVVAPVTSIKLIGDTEKPA